MFNDGACSPLWAGVRNVASRFEGSSFADKERRRLAAGTVGLGRRPAVQAKAVEKTLPTLRAFMYLRKKKITFFFLEIGLAVLMVCFPWTGLHGTGWCLRRGICWCRVDQRNQQRHGNEGRAAFPLTPRKRGREAQWL